MPTSSGKGIHDIYIGHEARIELSSSAIHETMNYTCPRLHTGGKPTGALRDAVFLEDLDPLPAPRTIRICHVGHGSLCKP